VLAVATVALAVLSEALIGVVEPALRTLGLTEAFTGLIVIPIIGNAAEHLVSVQFAWRGDMEFAMVVALGSSLQVALFVGPVLVLLSHLTATPLNLVFSPLEIVTIGLAVLIVYAIASDGRSNWFEGAELLSVYAIVGLAFWFFK
jgi:Ca2+:H+ antiporter